MTLNQRGRCPAKVTTRVHKIVRKRCDDRIAEGDSRFAPYPLLMSNSYRHLTIAFLACTVLLVGCKQASPPEAAATRDRSVQPDRRTGSSGKPELNSREVAQSSDDSMPSGYVGTATCATCHDERHASFLHTHHSRSLRLIDPDSDQSNGCTIEHQKSWRRYEVVKKEGRLFHREYKRFGSDPSDTVPVNELPARYVMGSGAFANGYLLADGDYLMQSPVTWYANQNSFAMAPGYDKPDQLGMTRMIDDECLFCHAGLVSRKESNPRKSMIHELAIGCERCHGPGLEHTKLYRSITASLTQATAIEDTKIVNPSDLDRLELESICAQCHLQGEVVVHAARRNIWDFRPGEDLAATRLHYQTQAAGDFNKVFTGHFDQLWQSECYLQSETLTCVTCHDSHPSGPSESQPEERRRQQRRDQCDQCHHERGCPVAIDEREQSNRNDCVACHMPSLESEVPHTSTTSHLIAVYRDGKPQNISVDPAGLKQIQPDTTLPKTEELRRRTIAEMYYAVDQAQLGNFDLLDQYDLDSINPGLRNDRERAGEITSLIARLADLKSQRMASDPAAVGSAVWLKRQSLEAAMRVVKMDRRPDRSREAALEILGPGMLDAGQTAGAIDALGELTRIRRVAGDHYNLALVLARARRMDDAERLLREAIQIDGSYAPAYRSLSILYRTANPPMSRQAATMADRLRMMPKVIKDE